MHLYVKPPNGYVTVSAPLAMSNEAIERFVRTKITWVKRQIGKFDDQPRQSVREYVSGETLYVWGKQYYLQTIYGNKNSLVLSGDKAVLTVRRESTVEQRENFVREWYRELLKKEIVLVLPKWEKITGLKADNWQTKYMISRWGTCNIKKRKIWLNLQLAKKTPECLDYVILHELIHLVEKNHNDRFISLMDKYLPMWREIKVTLNGQTLDYME
jgi:predicted metal-dependent hydrolase